MHITIHTDGGARGNPGPSGIGVVIQDETGKILKEIARYIGETTNNFAEYEALIAGLEAAQEILGEASRDARVEVFMDSELVVRQCQGLYKIKEPSLKEQYARVAHIKMNNLPNVTFAHVPREKNAGADALVNKAIDEALEKM